MSMHVKRTARILKPDQSRVLLRRFSPGDPQRVGRITWELRSPIETDAGWLVLSHDVGPMRTYCIGAFLLDRDDPAKVIGRLREPLLKPNQSEREGYVPNVFIHVALSSTTAN